MSTTEIDTLPGLFEKPIMVSLARALAEAAAGYGNEGAVYFVASYEPMPAENGFHEMYGPYGSVEEAENELKTLPPGKFAVFGPFETQSEPVPENSVENITVTVTGTAGTHTIQIPGLQYDTLFYSVEAVKKFALPYYCELYGPKFAEEALAAFVAAPVALMAHLPWSEYGMLAPEVPISGCTAGGGTRKWIPVVFELSADGVGIPRPIYPHHRHSPPAGA